MKLRKTLIAGVLSLMLLQPATAGIPVIDAGNLVQNILTAIESTSQTVQLINQYQTQLQQYQNQLQNTIGPTSQIWDQAQSTMQNLRNAIDTLSYYRNQLGSIDAYLRRTGDLDYYGNSPCFNGGECTDVERARLEEAQRFGYSSQKRANDALFRGLEQQHNTIVSDAARLEQLQAAARSANGQVQAIGYANQLASHQTNQLLQIRALLIAQQNAETTRMQAQMDEEARQQAARNKFRRNRAVRSTSQKAWGPGDI